MSNPPVKVPSHNPLPNKERMKLPRQRVPEQEPEVRAHNFQEVNLGFPVEQARQESLRCIECAKPGCSQKCPVSVDVRAVIDLILAERLSRRSFEGSRRQRAAGHHRPRLSGR